MTSLRRIQKVHSFDARTGDPGIEITHLLPQQEVEDLKILVHLVGDIICLCMWAVCDDQEVIKFR